LSPAHLDVLVTGFGPKVPPAVREVERNGARWKFRNTGGEPIEVDATVHSAVTIEPILVGETARVRIAAEADANRAPVNQIDGSELRRFVQQ
jgi:hypothetical protein